MTAPLRKRSRDRRRTCNLPGVNGVLSQLSYTAKVSPDTLYHQRYPSHIATVRHSLAKGVPELTGIRGPKLS